jgi:hypothetical protein
MRKGLILFMGVFLSLITADNALAQLKKGQMELSLGAAFQGVKESEEDMNYAFSLSSSFGYFLARRFEIEPEIILSIYDEGDPGLVLSGNFLYNLAVEERSKSIPFLLVGGGWANSVQSFNLVNSGDEGRNYAILNLGVGIRFFLTGSAALRFEYRFQRFFAEKLEIWDRYGHHSTEDPSLSYHTFLFGISVFLK